MNISVKSGMIVFELDKNNSAKTSLMGFDESGRALIETVVGDAQQQLAYQKFLVSERDRITENGKAKNKQQYDEICAKDSKITELNRIIVDTNAIIKRMDARIADDVKKIETYERALAEKWQKFPQPIISVDRAPLDKETFYQQIVLILVAQGMNPHEVIATAESIVGDTYKHRNA